MSIAGGGWGRQNHLSPTVAGFERVIHDDPSRASLRQQQIDRGSRQDRRRPVWSHTCRANRLRFERRRGPFVRSTYRIKSWSRRSSRPVQKLLLWLLPGRCRRHCHDGSSRTQSRTNWPGWDLRSAAQEKLRRLQPLQGLTPDPERVLPLFDCASQCECDCAHITWVKSTRGRLCHRINAGTAADPHFRSRGQI